ncbi:MAG TPA: SDR family NAD(P)-dependent oxidoreductase [Rhodocyclaceae bacterium]|uniref:SDR family NAD(P)-dependent oxidoreductase n=1 Tax=Zoogloea sp. TaxID=49181 RepID=UPI002BBAC298|nr:SDR family NAD(P)-dependent oxidoreductase [Zoogloea sp.]HMV18278.1 SDR family NAD(P)-dependent oxidoreductase [Rhodocyclaceae bacterium]HMW50932.1 SDR family NAD(P)-dependent oxidoreductase [Rhodocyclaceae bacterium]HMY50473.1 SDR family NAD(P)-dependent oxidoreductase [Rhodocyclaceae bacterium]HMZ77089.1 SDR family NAD(P)-dependent oxidoreductase [Rhodocyclaceae bacterium]HNH17505.1 SDR family NAD(P)-dependent oxidoreductase [Zoogloea sp.]
MQKIVIVGATSAMAEHCARLWAAQGPVDFTLVVRDAHKATAIADDLRVRSPGGRVRVLVADFLTPAGIRAAVDQAAAGTPIDIALIAHGSLPDQKACETDLSACNEALQVNGVSPALFAEAFAGTMLAAGRGTLALIGSVAGDRGRKSNYAYGAAKGLVTRYAQGLQHRLAGSPIKVVLIKPGPTETPMTAHLAATGMRMAPVEDVARDIVAAVTAGAPVAYTPGKWRIIMMVIRHLPAFIFNKMNI